MEKAPFPLDGASHPMTHVHIPVDDDEDVDTDNDEDSDDYLSDDPDSEDDVEHEAVQMDRHPEQAFLPLPSHFRDEGFRNTVFTVLASDELNLRVKQALDALQQLRLSLGLKSALFRKKVRGINSQWTKTRAWRAVKSVQKNIRKHAQVYHNARQALLHLSADPSVMKKFPVLNTEDLKMSGDVVEENRVGQRSEHVAWIWRQDDGQGTGENALLQESEFLMIFSR